MVDRRVEVGETEKEFEVIFAFTGWIKTVVKARNEDEAREFAYEDGYSFVDDSYEITDDWIEEVNESQ